MDMDTYDSILRKIFENENYEKLGINQLEIYTLKAKYGRDKHNGDRYCYKISFDDIKKQEDELFLKIKTEDNEELRRIGNSDYWVESVNARYVPVSSIVEIIVSKEISRKEVQY